MTSPFAIRMAARHVRSNGVIIYPTETVYGLGCDPKSLEAVQNINQLKCRNINTTFLLLASNISQLNQYIVSPDQDELERINTAATATSWVTKANANAPPWLVSPDGTIGFRITKHSVAKQLCDHLNHPIVSTSANIKGGIPVSNTLKCHQVFAGTFDYLLTSAIRRSEKPSKIINLKTGKQLRQ